MLEFFFKLIKNPKVIFIAHIMFSWYVMIVLPAILAAYYFLTGLQASGLMGKIQGFITQNISMVVGLVKECTPRLANLADFINCF